MSLTTRRISGQLPYKRAILSLIACGVSAVVAIGCAGSTPPKDSGQNPASEVSVKTTHPKRQSLAQVVEQPGRIDAYEQAPLFAKVTGFVDKVNVDIGAKVHKGDVLAELSLPEMDKELLQKKAAVALAQSEIEQAEKAVKAAEAVYQTAQSLVQEAQFAAKRAQADLELWQSQYARMEKLARGKVLEEQERDEAMNQVKSATAGVGLANAKIQSAEANQREMKAKLEKAQADVDAARSRRRFAEADQARIEAWLAYTKIPAPFDGVVSERHVDPGHFLQPGMSGGANKTQPLFIVARADSVRVFVDVPETDAVSVKKGLSATIRIQALGEADYKGEVAGVSWTLDPAQRTMRAEIDMKNPNGELRPGMYAYASIPMQRPEVLTLPIAAVLTRDNQAVCFCVENGKAVRTPLHLGFRAGGVVEVLKKQTSQANGEKRWENLTGQEEVILTDVGNLTDGQPVKIGD